MRTSAMYRAQQALGARFRDDAGWKVADVYTSPDDEVARARAGVGLSDLSACGKLGVQGEAIEALVTKLTGRPAPEVGAASRERVNGAPLLIAHLAADELLVLTAPGDHEIVADLVAKTADTLGCVHVTDLSAAFAVVDLVGSRVGALLERLVPIDLSALPALGLVQAELARVHAVILRADHPRLPAYRVLVPREYGDFVWRTLMDAGHDLGLTPVGAAAHARLGAEA
ncbi:MAG: hypothetical protein HYU41_27185 [Candidatus Rokubacteria bacterium]|nr:hypothetical protein [Candidatus Rokubacteria bacterium]